MDFEADKRRYIAEADAYLHANGTLPAGRSLANTGHNDQLDAFRHAYVSGRFAQQYGGAVSSLMGQVHEYRNPNDPPEQQMDIWNNNKGIQYAATARTPRELADAVMHGIRTNDLQLHPGDQRPQQRPGNSDYSSLAPTPGDGVQLAQLSAAEQLQLRDFLGARGTPFPEATPGVMLASAEAARGALLPPGHPDRALFGDVRQKLGAAYAQHGIDAAPDTLDRDSLGVTVAARRAGLEHVDHVVLGRDGENLFAVQGRLDDPAHSRHAVARNELAALPVEESLRQLDTLARQRIETAPQPVLAQTREQEDQRAPAVRSA